MRAISITSLPWFILSITNFIYRIRVSIRWVKGQSRNVLTSHSGSSGDLSPLSVSLFLFEFHRK